MKIAVVAAGPGLGAAVARRFGREGFEIALISRNPEKLAAELEGEGLNVTARKGDVLDEHALTGALDASGPVDVLLYHGSIALTALAPVRAVTRENAHQAFDATVLGAITSVRAVLPGMLERGQGTLLFTSGLSAIHPIPFLGNAGLAIAAQRNYALALAESLAGTEVHVGYVPIGARIEPGSAAAPEVVAETHWRLHVDRDVHEVVLGDLETVRAAVKAVEAGAS